MRTRRASFLLVAVLGCGCSHTGQDRQPQSPGPTPASPDRAPSTDALRGRSGPGTNADTTRASTTSPSSLSDQRATRPTWPAPERFRATQASLNKPWTVVPARDQNDTAHETRIALAQRDAQGWKLGAVFGDDGEAEPPAGCDPYPCAWPASLVPARPLSEESALPDDVLTDIAYARTLLDFEGPLLLSEAPNGSRERFAPTPEALRDVIDGGDKAAEQANLAPHLEALRRYQPVGGCSMDRRPQQVALLRARAAAQAGRTGWAVQGWADTVGYWSSRRVAWSSYGQRHPEGHLSLLQQVHVDPERLFVGLVLRLPDLPVVLGLSDARRVAPDLGSPFASKLRRLAAASGVDPLNRAVLLAVVADLPFSADPLFSSLPPESQRLLEAWSR